MAILTDDQPSIHVLIADDHAVVREGLRTLINTEPGMEIIGEAQDGSQAIDVDNFRTYDLAEQILKQKAAAVDPD